MNASQRGKRNRRHGHDTERMVVAYLRAHGWQDACTTRSKLGHDGAHAPGDIDFAPGVCLEVKSVAQPRWGTWRAQCVAEAGGRIPVVVRRTRGVTDVGQWEAQMRRDDVLDLLNLRWPESRAFPDGIYCARTDTRWHRTTFSDVCALLAIEH